jgi:hypothetical protein
VQVLGAPFFSEDEIGVAFGEISADGAVQVWPLHRELRGDGTQALVPDQMFGSHLIRPPRSPSPGASTPAAPTVDAEKYRQWVVDEYRDLEMVGLGAGHVPVRLDDVYVGLRLWGGRIHRQAPTRAVRDMNESGAEEVELVDALRVAGDRHVAIFGEPGAGKTTALKKLLSVAATSGLEGLGLDAQPVFLPLRRMTDADLAAEHPLRAFMVRSLEDQSQRFISREEAEGLADGPVLYLLDALDEVAEARRPKVIETLQKARGRLRQRGSRMVVSCRLRQGIELGKNFLRLNVRPLDAERRREFIDRYFLALCKALTLDANRLAEAEARARKQAEELVAKLEDPKQLSFEMRALVATPLLLALLCIVSHRDRELPPRRVDFYRECLEVLLRWRKQANVEPFCEVGDALLVLEAIAAFLHGEGRREDLTVSEVESRFGQMIKRTARGAGHRKTPRDFVNWLHEQGGSSRTTGTGSVGSCTSAFRSISPPGTSRRRETSTPSPAAFTPRTESRCSSSPSGSMSLASSSR